MSATVGRTQNLVAQARKRLMRFCANPEAMTSLSSSTRGCWAIFTIRVTSRSRLSSANHHSASVAVLVAAEHESGRAIQDKQAYAPLQMRLTSVGISSCVSRLVMWIPLLGLFAALLAPKVGLLSSATTWGIMMSFNLVTLPVEFDASRPAKHELGQTGCIQAVSEWAAVRRALSVGGWTYAVAPISSPICFLRHLLPPLTGRQRNKSPPTPTDDQAMPNRRPGPTRMKHKTKRNVERVCSPGEFGARLRRLADALDRGQPFSIQVAEQRVAVPAIAIFSIEHERDAAAAELEFRVKWKRNPNNRPDFEPSQTKDGERSMHDN